MGRGPGCSRCGGPKRNTIASAPIANCAQCHQPICNKHLRFIHDQWICTKCAKLE